MFTSSFVFASFVVVFLSWWTSLAVLGDFVLSLLPPPLLSSPLSSPMSTPLSPRWCFWCFRVGRMRVLAVRVGKEVVYAGGSVAMGWAQVCRSVVVHPNPHEVPILMPPRSWCASYGFGAVFA